MGCLWIFTVEYFCCCFDNIIDDLNSETLQYGRSLSFILIISIMTFYMVRSTVNTCESSIIIWIFLAKVVSLQI